MSTAILRSPEPESPYAYLVKRTVEACQVAKEAAATAAEGIATASCPLLNTLREREKELDRLDMEIDAGVTQVVTQVTDTEARELLACMKFMISLERIGDLLLSFAGSAQAVCARLDPQDIRDLTHMATVLEKMLADAGTAFSTRDVKKAVDVLRADAEIDRLRNLIFLRHIENPENCATPRQPAGHLHDPVAGARGRSCQESRGRSLPFRERPYRPPRPDDLRQTDRTDVSGLAARTRRPPVKQSSAGVPHAVGRASCPPMC